MRRSIIQCLLGTSLSAAVISPLWAFQAELVSAQDLLAQGDNQSAYSQLRATELEHSGNPEYDYWLGVTALRAGEASHALMALERAILRQPTHAGARMERVAALVQLDQLETAKREIKQLQALSPPPDAQAAIARFQALIEQRQQAKNGPQHQGLLGVDIGYDSNPQQFPNEIAIDPLRPDIRRVVEELIDLGLEPNGDPSMFDKQVFSRDASSYQRLQGNYQGLFPIDSQSRWRINTTGQAQRYTEVAAQDYDLTLAQAQLGYQRDLAAQRTIMLKGSALQGWSGPSQSRLLTRWGSGVDLRHPIGLDSELTWQLDAQHNRFSAANNNYDSGRLGVQLNTNYTALRTRLTAQIEHEWATGIRDGGDLLHLLLGAGIDYPLSDRHLIRANLNHRIRTYQEDGYAPFNEFSATTRRDRIWQARLSWLHQFNTDWLLEASADVERRRSSVNFFDTRRYQTQLALRYLF
ncbi:tetratricopeptide repeat protein [Vreelandella sp. V005]|uniref:tetratricopeptide repeat protein n=1 Tax=Vreelandella sp. V005 TaxID=3459608 RepID=UPI0040444759